MTPLQKHIILSSAAAATAAIVAYGAV